MIKRSINQEYVTNTNVHIPINRTPKLTELKEVGHSTTVVKY